MGIDLGNKTQHLVEQTRQVVIDYHNDVPVRVTSYRHVVDTITGEVVTVNPIPNIRNISELTKDKDLPAIAAQLPAVSERLKNEDLSKAAEMASKAN